MTEENKDICYFSRVIIKTNLKEPEDIAIRAHLEDDVLEIEIIDTPEAPVKGYPYPELLRNDKIITILSDRTVEENKLRDFYKELYTQTESLSHEFKENLDRIKKLQDM